MEEEIRAILKKAGDGQVNLSSEFAREQILADIMKVTEKKISGVLREFTEEEIGNIQSFLLEKYGGTIKQNTGIPEYYDYKGK